MATVTLHHATFDSAWWTAVGTWFAAVGTVSVAVWLLVYQIRDRRDKQTEARLSQAKSVAAWVQAYDYTADPPTIYVRVINGSPLPIRNVAVRVPVGVRGTFVRVVTAMGPHETREWRIILTASPRTEFVVPALMFTDTADVTWIRGEIGTLIEPTLDQRQAHNVQDPGTFETEADHPTLNPPWGDIDLQYGRRVGD
jgi:hypothetical protein